MSRGDVDSPGPVETVERVSGTGIAVRGNDIDTDQIIPARYLKAITFEGLDEYVFYDQRRRDAGSETQRTGGEVADNGESDTHPFDDEQYRDASILVVNANFGCGSSREHAPQALMRWGIDAIVGESFAEIFAGNCLALGIPTLTAVSQEIRQLQDHVEEYPDTEITVDVADKTVTYGDRVVEATVEDAQRTALVEGVWDTTALLQSNRKTVYETARSLPYVDPSAIDDAPGAPGVPGTVAGDATAGEE